MSVNGKKVFAYKMSVIKPTNRSLTILTSQTLILWIPMVIAVGQHFISQQGVAPL